MSPSGAVDWASTEVDVCRPLARLTGPPLRRMLGPHKDTGGGLWDPTLTANFRRPAGSGLGGPPLEVRDLSLPLIGEEETPPVPGGGGASLTVGASLEDEAPFVLSEGLPAIPAGTKNNVDILTVMWHRIESVTHSNMYLIIHIDC